MPPPRPPRAALRALLLALVAPLLAAAAGPVDAAAADAAPIPVAPAQTVPGEVVVGFVPRADAGARGAARTVAGVAPLAALAGPRVQLVHTDGPVAAAVAALRRQPGVAWAEPNHVVRAAAPSDPRFAHQWGLRNRGQVRRGVPGLPGADSGAARAWSISTGSAATIVGIVDSGIDLDHPDLLPSLWVNPAPGSSGCGPADLHGCDFTRPLPHGRPQDGNGHGTHVAGIVGAATDNGIGVAGVCGGCRLLTAQALRADGFGSSAGVAAAIAYAVRNGARVVNLSLGAAAESIALRTAIRDAPHVLFVAAAGNGDDAGAPIDVDAQPTYPCATDLPNVVCVAATDHRDLLAPWSNRGAATVDLAAPGVDVVSTYRGGGYAAMDGTSMATPFVAGAAALAFSARPDATVAQVRAALLATAAPRPGLAGATVTGGRLDAAELLAALTGVAPAPLPDDLPPPDAPEAPSGDDPPLPPPDVPAPPPPPAGPGQPPAASPRPPAPRRGAPQPPPPRRGAAPRPGRHGAVLPRPARRGLLDRRVAVVRLACPASRRPARCAGRLSLHPRLAARAGRRDRSRPLGVRRYALAPGTSATMRVAIGRGAIRGGARRVAVRATVAAGVHSETWPVTLRRWQR